MLNQNYTDNSGDSYYSNNSSIVDNMFTPSATSIAATNTNNEEISGDEMNSGVYPSATSIAATNTNNKEISGDDRIVDNTFTQQPQLLQQIPIIKRFLVMIE